MSIFIEVFEDFNKLIGYVEDFIELKFERCYRNIGYFKMELNNFTYSDILKIDNQILINKTDLFIIKKIEQYKNINGELIMNIEGADPSCYFQDRVMDRSYKMETTTKYNNFLQTLVTANVKTEGDRKIDFFNTLTFSNSSTFTDATDLNPTNPFTFKIYNLKEGITRICAYGDFGYKFAYNLTKTTGQIQFYTFKGKNLTNKIFFSEEYGNIDNLELNINTFDNKNVGYIVDEEKENIIETIDLEQKTGIQRKEILIEGEEKTESINNLKKSMKNIITVNMDILSNEQFKYRRDFDVGDTVTYENKTFNFAMTNTIMKVTEIYKNNNQYLEIQLGERSAEFGD